MKLLMNVVVGLMGVIFVGPVVSQAHPIEGKYVQVSTGYVFEIDADGYVVTDLNVSAYFGRPYHNTFAGLVTITAPLRRYHPTAPFLVAGTTSANGCSYATNFEVSYDASTTTLTVDVIQASSYEIWDGGVCMHASFGSRAERHILELRN